MSLSEIEKEFLKSCSEEPKDPVHIMAYHDWLIDHHRGADAQSLRNSLLLGKVEKLEDLKGRIIASISETEDELVFTLISGEKCKFYHEQDCCEHVSIEDIVGNLHELIGFPLVQSEESSESGSGGEGSETWTFYRFATKETSVTIRWYGTSNGYYSESVTFGVINK